MSKLGLWKAMFFICALCGFGVIDSPAQTFTTLLNFDGTNGGLPLYSSLVQGTDGNFYGTSEVGGTSTNCTVGCGTVFKITPAGTLTTLHNFESTDGSFPVGGLVQATDSNFYGTTYAGGASSNCSGGCGTVFKITPTGTFTTLHSFEGTDGANPEGALLEATNGQFYGTTWAGGTNDSCQVAGVGCGTVFKITPAGTLTMLHSFDGSDGSYPTGALVQATNGNLYGTADLGGQSGAAACATYGCGTVFMITPTGAFTLLHSFDSADGFEPNWLVQATNGDFYGTATGGGASTNCDGGCGTAFEITPAGTLTVLHSFDGSDGSFLSAGLVQATDGNFYGTAGSGGASSNCTGGCGTVFELTPTGTLTTLHSFDGTDGSLIAGLIQGTHGAFYGLTSTGGSDDSCDYYAGFAGCGTVFSLGTGLGPFVETEPTSGAVGTIVTILGNNLAGATRVTFNGTAARFQVLSGTEILTVVPTGATTGLVHVRTPSGTLGSNLAFRVVAQQNAPPVRIASLQETVEALVSAGTINAGQGQSLLASLNGAATALADGHTAAAIADLLSFIERVGFLTISGPLRGGVGPALTDAAISIIVELA